MSHMELKKIHKIVISAVTLIVLVLLYIFIYERFNKSEAIPVDSIDFSKSTTTQGKLANGLEYKIEKIDNKTTTSVPKPIPDLNRPITKSPLAANVTEKDIESARTKVKEFQQTLKNNPSNFAVWLDMAMYQKAGGDYDGAIISWEYAGKLSPTDYISVANIGNLYAYNIKDNAKAISYYEKAIKKAPSQVYLYAQLAGIYLDIMNDKTNALEVINRGLKNIPNDSTLLGWKDIIK